MDQYLPLVERVAKAEYRRIPSYMMDYRELVNIGAIAIQALVANKTAEELARLNTSYIATATRWAIRNELRARYKWYTLQHRNNADANEGGDEESATDNDNSGERSNNVREAVYETILSIEGIQDNAGDGDSTYEFLKDGGARPDERLEIRELGKAIRKAIAELPPKERTIMEYRFYRNMQVKDIAALVGLSSSRITRIVQASINKVRTTLRECDHLE